MTISSKSYAAAPELESNLLSEDDALPQLALWQAQGKRTALVTLVSVEGVAPRQPGAQMAVNELGEYAGYLSGGCLESAVALEAHDVISATTPRLVRYGKGSRYFDIKLPCGSGLDLFFDPLLNAMQIAEMTKLRAARRPFALETDLTTGSSSVRILPSTLPAERSARDGNRFNRVYGPALRLLLLGAGPAMVALAALAAAAGIGVCISTADETTRQQLTQQGFGQFIDKGAPDELFARLDSASAAILLFHDHPQEYDLLERLLRSQCFFIGALGNHAVHRARLAILSERGIEATVLARIRAPVGLIPGAKSKATFAVGVLAEIFAHAKSLNLIS